MSQRISVTRRQFLRLTAASSGVAFLTACGVQTAPEPTATAVPSISFTTAPSTGDIKVMAGDVIEYVFESDEWEGLFGKVTFHLNQGLYNGEPIYFIRTDASDEAYAMENKLVHVPLLNAGKEIAGTIYFFADGRLPVLSSSPGDADFVSLFEVKNVRVGGDEVTLDSAQAVEDAASSNRVVIEETGVYVNHPVVKWPGGQLSVDDEKTATLGKGQLMEQIDTDKMTVVLKLHACFPGSRYILTDTSSEGMAPMMSIPQSEPTQKLMDMGATDEIWVFANGIPGSGVMGFQPAIFDNEAGQPAWSPFWNHFTLKWVDESNARVLRSSTEIRELLASGELEEFNGVPDTHPNGFVVNCPAPILAPNNFTG